MIGCQLSLGHYYHFQIRMRCNTSGFHINSQTFVDLPSSVITLS